ncbi:MAG: hypothetical protein ACRCYS_15780 [Beijerinckiaceae bacterium]
MTRTSDLHSRPTSYAATMASVRRNQAWARRLQYLARTIGICAVALVLAHTALGAAARVTEDLVTAEALRGW